MTPIEALLQDPEAQRLERNRQETPWLDHEKLRSGDLVAFEHLVNQCSNGEPGMQQYYWHTLHMGLLIKWARLLSNRGSEFWVLLRGRMTSIRIYDNEASQIRVRLVQQRRLT